MTDQPLNRRLAAILAADIAGYSRLMSLDEEATHRRVLSIRQDCIDPAIARHHGRVVKNTGDGFLAEFASVLDAVRCAIELQNGIASANAGVPIDRQILFRMGVNIGDIIVEPGDIFGDGVNIAARLEALAQPGSIAVSSKVREEIQDRLDVGVEDLGPHTVKNIPRPVHVYRLVWKPGDRIVLRFRRWPVNRMAVAAVASLLALIVIVAAVAVLVPSSPIRNILAGAPLLAKLVPADKRMNAAGNAAPPIPNGPSLAVMPFENLTGDPSRSYIADGLAENITSTLSTLSNMFVVSRYSVLAYKDKKVPVQQVAHEQGVSHVLLASVQQAGERYRVTAQLVDAASARLVWSDRYDYPLQNLLATEDAITQNIVTALQVNLTEGEQARAHDAPTRNFEAWGLAMRGYTAFQKIGPETNAQARRLLEQAIALDPGYAWAWAYLAANHALAARFGFAVTPAESLQRAFTAASRAVELDPNLAEAHATLGSIHLFRREYEKAIAEGRIAVALGPSNAEDHALLAQSLYYSGEFREALALIAKAERLSPRHPAWYLFVHAPALIYVGEYSAAIAQARRSLELAESPFNQTAAHVMLAFALVEDGRVAEAREHAAAASRIVTNRGVAALAKASLFRDPAHVDRFVVALRKAGWPE